MEPGENGNTHVVIGGEANRNHMGFGDKFKKIADEIGSEIDREVVSHA
nr:hypothetical protein [uncultured bacterium]